MQNKSQSERNFRNKKINKKEFKWKMCAFHSSHGRLTKNSIFQFPPKNIYKKNIICVCIKYYLFFFYLEYLHTVINFDFFINSFWLLRLCVCACSPQMIATNTKTNDIYIKCERVKRFQLILIHCTSGSKFLNRQSI
jgi:hypothetical protein